MPRRKMSSSPPLDLSFARAATIITPEHHEVRLVLVGCGGTGSFLSGSLARLARALSENGCKTSVAFIDPDRVEEKNLGRQNFAEAELGYFKSATLAARFSAAWGLEIQAVTVPFDHRMIAPDWRTLTIIAGAVDNAAARRELAQSLNHNYRHEAPRIWWCDAGNFEEAGLFGEPRDSGGHQWTGDSYKFGIYLSGRGTIIIQQDGSGIHPYLLDELEADKTWREICARLTPELLWNLCISLTSTYRKGREDERNRLHRMFLEGKLKKLRRHNTTSVVEMP